MLVNIAQLSQSLCTQHVLHACFIRCKSRHCSRQLCVCSALHSPKVCPRHVLIFADTAKATCTLSPAAQPLPPLHNLQHQSVKENVLHCALHEAWDCLVVWPFNRRSEVVSRTWLSIFPLLRHGHIIQQRNDDHPVCESKLGATRRRLGFTTSEKQVMLARKSITLEEKIRNPPHP